MDFTYWKTAHNSITASRWTLLCARIFGRKATGHDGFHHVRIARWRGKGYLLDYWEDRASGSGEAGR
ncbi:MAG: hypothetical protein RLN67_13825 [Algiphilus sp.]|uniref:hypothetical protein n=1 Tax=Algiphilus sp. TaxID=1872431 RepID=UPI0032EF0D24